MICVVNVDIWNIWYMIFIGVMLYIVIGLYWIGIFGVVVYVVFVYKLGDWFVKDICDFFGFEGIVILYGSLVYLGLVVVFVDIIIDKIFGFNCIYFSVDDIQKCFGFFGELVIVGFVMGLVIGVLVGYDLKGIFQLVVKIVVVMLLMFWVIKLIMDGFILIVKQVCKCLQVKFGGQEFLIGFDLVLLFGYILVVLVSLIFILLIIFIVVVVSGNQVLLFGDLVIIGFFVVMVVVVYQGNLFCMLIFGVIIMGIILWIVIQIIGLYIQLVVNVGVLKVGGMVVLMDQGGLLIIWLLIQFFIW